MSRDQRCGFKSQKRAPVSPQGRNARCAGLDWFRFPAALLIVAIHTSPLSSFSDYADFWLTRVLARVAVPFFFMVSGYFLLPRIRKNPGVLARETKKLLVIYLAAILLYLPLNLYSGQLTGMNPGSFLKMLFFDGAFYHLWYLPAIIEGLVLVTLLQRFLSKKGCFLVCLALYIVGLGGDSYYGLWEKAAPIKAMYDGMFHVFSYTRNGIFFAPLFLCLGWSLRGVGQSPAPCGRTAADSPGLTAHQEYGIGFLLFLGFMTAEAFLLRFFGLQRHDSMYLFLVPCMTFLFLWLLGIQRKAPPALPSLSLTIYLIHPWVIVLARGAAKLLHLYKVFVEQSLIHYLTVALGSCILAVVLWKIKEKTNVCGRKSTGTPSPKM